MEILIEYINKHKNVQIFSRYGNYSEDRVKLLENFNNANVIISNRVESFSQTSSKLLFVYLECKELFPLADHHRICKKIRDSRYSPYPYHLDCDPSCVIVSSLLLEDISSIEKLKLLSKKFKANDTIAIDSNLTSDEIEIAKDLLCLLVLENIPFKWLFLGETSGSLTVTHASQYLKCVRFSAIAWDKIIPEGNSNNLQQVCLLPDDDTLAEINCHLGRFTTKPNESIVVGLPKWE